MSAQTLHRPVPARDGIVATLLTKLRGLCDRIVDRIDDEAPGASHRPDDPWDAGYRAGRRAGYRQAARDHDADPVTYRAPYREASEAAASWWQGFKIGFYDGAAERS